MKNLFLDQLELNRQYVALLSCDSTAAEQEAALDACGRHMAVIIEAGLATEYRVFCETKSAKEALA